MRKNSSMEAPLLVEWLRGKHSDVPGGTVMSRLEVFCDVDDFWQQYDPAWKRLRCQSQENDGRSCIILKVEQTTVWKQQTRATDADGERKDMHLTSGIACDATIAMRQLPPPSSHHDSIMYTQERAKRWDGSIHPVARDNSLFKLLPRFLREDSHNDETTPGHPGY